MQSGFPAGDAIDRAERTILRIKEVRSCRIVRDDSGEIAEVHVVAGGGRPPKKIARDVESILKAEAGIDIDHRKIGVVLLEEHLREGSEGPGPIREDLEILEDFSRIELHAVSVATEAGIITAAVTLARDGLEAVGHEARADVVQVARHGRDQHAAVHARLVRHQLAKLGEDVFRDA